MQSQIYLNSFSFGFVNDVPPFPHHMGRDTQVEIWKFCISTYAFFAAMKSYEYQMVSHAPISSIITIIICIWL